MNTMFICEKITKEDIVTDRQKKVPRLSTVFCAILVFAISFVGMYLESPESALAANNGLAATPLLGWSSWSRTETINLNAGGNTILFSNATAFGSDFDRITV